MVNIRIKSKCLICFDTGQYFDGENYVLCDHVNNSNSGLVSDEKIEVETDILEDNEDTD
jgi:hypothetical protein